jgi:hypothetical protein
VPIFFCGRSSCNRLAARDDACEHAERRICPRWKQLYAGAISIGVASNTPSVIDGYACASVPTPMRCQRPATLSKPAISATLIVATLRESASARRSVISPSYSFS